MTTTAAPAVALTPRELEILGHIAAGRSRPEIARILGSREVDVRAEAERIYRTLGAVNAVNAIHRAHLAGVFGPATAAAGQAPDPPAERHLVWSRTHRAWWGRSAAGYTADITAAGRYTRERAQEACSRRVWRSAADPPEVYVLAPECWPRRFAGPESAAYLRFLIHNATQRAILARSAASRGQAVAS